MPLTDLGGRRGGSGLLRTLVALAATWATSCVAPREVSPGGGDPVGPGNFPMDAIVAADSAVGMDPNDVQGAGRCEQACPVSADPCVTWECREGACVALAGAELCNDGDPCTSDVCLDGCRHFTLACEPGCAPEAPADDPCSAPMVPIPGGTFIRGSPRGEGYPIDTGEDWPNGPEWPAHFVTLPPFEIDRVEVTVARYARFLEAHGNECLHTRYPWMTFPCYYGCSVDGGPIECAAKGYEIRDDCRVDPTTKEGSCASHPIVGVSWFGAHAYCAWVGRRLPTAAEWERAAQGPAGPDGRWWRRFPWSTGCAVKGPLEEFTAADCPPGDECPAAFDYDYVPYLVGCTGAAWTPATARANCQNTFCADGFGHTAPVGSFPLGASMEGVLDMSGNVQEWVLDFFTQRLMEQVDPGSVGPHHNRIERGGASGSIGSSLRIRAAHAGWPDAGGPYNGFRCAR